MRKASFSSSFTAVFTIYGNTAGQHGCETNNEEQCESVTWYQRYMPHLFPPYKVRETLTHLRLIGLRRSLSYC